MLVSIQEFLRDYKEMKSSRIFKSEGRLFLADPWGTDQREMSEELFDELLRHRVVYEDAGMGMELNSTALRTLEDLAPA